MVIELLHFPPENVWSAILRIMNTIYTNKEIPLRESLFPEKKMFACLLLSRAEAQLEHRQPEEQDGFKSYRKTEDYLLTAHMVIDNTLLANTPLWIARLDLSKAIDRAD